MTRAEWAKAWRARNPGRALAATRRYRERNPESALKFHIKCHYGLEWEDYQTLLTKQKGVCAICKKSKKLDVDHCHTTGRVRGLLCLNCNAGIGNLRDDPVLLKQALKYLKSKG